MGAEAGTHDMALQTETREHNEQAIDRFFKHCQRAPARVLLLDYDGTLAPFRVERDMAVPYPGVRELLDALIELGRTRVVVISGRWLEDLRPLLGLERLPELWGSHGWERLRADGRHEVFPIGERKLAGLEAAHRWAEGAGLQRRLETKPACAALHWRDLEPADAETLKRQIEPAWKRIGRDHGLRLHAFDGGLELRVTGRHKGLSVETVLGEEPAGAAACYLGDDLTDEDAFKALAARVPAEERLGVLVRRRFRPTAADMWLRPPEEMMSFLQRWLKMDAKEAS